MAMDRSVGERVKTFVIGGARDLSDRSLFRSLALIAFFAWVGLGADGLSSSAYGPQEAFLALGKHTSLAIFVALGAALTIIVISASYSQIIEKFPTGGGGYLVASKLISPRVGMVSGSALFIDYILTITVSVASGADAIFSFLPMSMQFYKLPVAVALVLVLIIMNMRGVKESVLPLIPIFMLFIITHFFLLGYGLILHFTGFHNVLSDTAGDFNNTSSEIGIFGVLFLIMKAYGLGAGTYTGIEAVSNGVPILRKPRVATAKRTMRYMAISLTLMVLGLMFTYLLFDVRPTPDKTLNAVLFSNMTAGWGSFGTGFVIVALLSEAFILLVAAQTGFLDGPRVLANMANDHWLPTRFSLLSDRLVIQNGILLMGGAAILTMLLSGGSVHVLVVLYSINVFITFSLSQAGMVRYWWKNRAEERKWLKKMTVNGIGLVMSFTILVIITAIKFDEGGWVTLFVTGTLILLALLIRRHYDSVGRMLHKLDHRMMKSGYSSFLRRARTTAEYASLLPRKGQSMVYTRTFDIGELVATQEYEPLVKPQPGGEGDATAAIAANGDHPYDLLEDSNIEVITTGKQHDPTKKTAILLVNGFNGLGLHTLENVQHFFGGVFKNFIFIQVGQLDAGNFKGINEVKHLRFHVKRELKRYVKFMDMQGFYAEGITTTAVDVVDEVVKTSAWITSRFPNSVFFGGQLVFPHETIFTRLLHNNIVFTLQRRFYHEGISFVILPVRI
jgi:amino acid transporter